MKKWNFDLESRSKVKYFNNEVPSSLRHTIFKILAFNSVFNIIMGDNSYMGINKVVNRYT